MNDTVLWVAYGAGGVVFLFILAWIVPARLSVMIDSTTAVAQTELRLFWGLGPKLSYQATREKERPDLVQMFADAPRIGNALMTPGIVDVTLNAVKQIFQLKPRVANLALSVNLGDSSKDLVMQTAVQGALALAPENLRRAVTFAKNEHPGAELIARFDAMASPLRVRSIYDRLRKSRPVREFRQRLRKKQKTRGKPPKEA